MDSSRISGTSQAGILSFSRKSVKKKSATSTQSSDEVSLSEDMQSLQQASAAARDASGIDEAKVAEIKNAIARGELQINAERLAQKMLEMEESIFKEKP